MGDIDSTNRIFESIIYYKRILFQLNESEERGKLQDLIDSIEYSEYSEDLIKQMRNYKNQVREYVKLQIKNPYKVIDPKTMITIDNPIKDKKFKILNGSIEIANQMNTYTTKLKEIVLLLIMNYFSM